MKITRIDSSFPAISIDDFMPSEALARAAAESFDRVPDEDWVQFCVFQRIMTSLLICYCMMEKPNIQDCLINLID